jgi:hypothetical protein
MSVARFDFVSGPFMRPPGVLEAGASRKSEAVSHHNPLDLILGEPLLGAELFTLGG